MGNAQFSDAERQCGKFPAPIIKKENAVSSPKAVGLKEMRQQSPRSRISGRVANNGTTHDTTFNEETRTTTTATSNEELGDSNDDSTGTNSKSKPNKLIASIKSTIHDIWNPPEPERLPPKRFPPKTRLFGCQTTDEHFDYIEEVCSRVSSLHGIDGLEAMGFHYQVVHHLPTCSCSDSPFVAMNNRSNENGEDDDLTDDESDGYSTDVSRDLLDRATSTSGEEYGQFEDDDGEVEMNSDNKFEQVNGEMRSDSFMVPIGESLKKPSTTTGFSSMARDSSPYGTPSKSSMSRASSTVSLFSLATHNSSMDGSIGKMKERFPLSTISSQKNWAVMEQDACALRLFYRLAGDVKAGGTMVTPENHLQFVAEGKMYDELARLCMEYAQEVMIKEGNLTWIALGEEKTFGALVTKHYCQSDNDRDGNGNGKRKSQSKTLLIITGKGEVKAGIFSRRHLIVTSMEAASALPFIRGANQRNMNVVMLDPNALGYRLGMDVVETSLTDLFLKNINGSCKDNDDEEVYILAHSMAGAQLVRFFSNHSSSYSRTPTPPTDEKALNGSCSNPSTSNASAATSTSDTLDKKKKFLKRICSLALTDSNHNINWTKKYPELTKFLTGPKAIYIKSHKVHEKAKQLGEVHHDCQFWKHRFGDIKTVWAGTHEHALTNYTAREPIWDHFDRFLLMPSEMKQYFNQQMEEEKSDHHQ